MNQPSCEEVRGALYEVLATIRSEAENLVKFPDYLTQAEGLIGAERIARALAVAERIASMRLSSAELVGIFRAEVDCRARLASVEPSPELAVLRWETYGSALSTAAPIEPAGEREYTEAVEILARTEGLKARGERLRLLSLEAERVAEVPPRTWFIEGMLTPGFAILSAKKGIGKSFFALEAAYAIAAGSPFLDRATTRAKVLYVPFELDRTAMHERALRLGPCPADVLVSYGWSSGTEAIADAEAAIVEHGVKVIVFDMFQAVLPAGLETNSYDSSPVFLSWRRMALQHGAAVIAVWHSGKGDREDPMLGPIGSTGLVGQADCVLALDRKRGENVAKLFIGGNHGHEETLSVSFDDCRWTLLGQGKEAPQLAASDSAVVQLLEAHPEGLSATTIAGTLGRPSSAAARASLSRLALRGLVVKRSSLWFSSTPPKAHEAHESAQGALFTSGQSGEGGARSAPAPIGGRALVRFPEPRSEPVEGGESAREKISAVRSCAPSEPHGGEGGHSRCDPSPEGINSVLPPSEENGMGALSDSEALIPKGVESVSTPLSRRDMVADLARGEETEKEAELDQAY
jgi:hypothetical protein